jgi:hypothetical protein
MTWYGHTLKMNKKSILKKVLNIKMKEKCHRVRQGNRLGKRDQRPWEETEDKLCKDIDRIGYQMDHLKRTCLRRRRKKKKIVDS